MHSFEPILEKYNPKTEEHGIIKIEKREFSREEFDEEYKQERGKKSVTPRGKSRVLIDLQKGRPTTEEIPGGTEVEEAKKPIKVVQELLVEDVEDVDDIDLFP